MREFTVGSMFAGIGGIDLGFKQAGFSSIWANEYNLKACQTFKNYPYLSETKLFSDDVSALDPSKVENVDVITSGFPCQAFSIAGYQMGFNDYKGRGNMFFETAKFIKKIKPKAYLLENVKNLKAHDKGKTFDTIRRTILEDLGYSFIPFVLNAKDFGNIPQTRERLYIVGFRNEASASNKDNFSLTSKFKIPEPIQLTKTISDMLLHDKQPDNFYYNKDHPYFQFLKKEMVNPKTIYQWRRVYVRENKNNVCPTLTANMGTGGHNVPLIIDNFGFRKLTPKECLNFQGFPENFNFPEGMAASHCYMQAGNSVVVPVIKRIAENIKKALNNG
ncbi:DNA (cytosine-5-)-methyltransferase [Leptospira meyeri]|uniref:DNA (cytosine-5-)-methyltransferase n=1 Tax=Leptospira meyeri TaxID=29508 RepID=UPI000C2AD73E|nr:DNA (cytosine-5-)-methyltransferase [Leptospira meyeri]PKA10525.1 DNA (cytosine-5-)-methyltransferase [Leptospira meyeri]